MKVAIGADHAGYELKRQIIKFLEDRDIIVLDFGTDSTESTDYPPIAFNVAKKVSNGEVTFGILICSTGIGMSIVANKISNIRAALCFTPEHALMSRRHNNANILALGSRYSRIDDIFNIVQTFLETKFEAGGRHERRVKQIHKITQL